MSLSETESGEWWSYERDENVGIWKIENWGRLFEEEIDEAESHYVETANRPEIEGALVVFESVDRLDAETQEYMTDVWSELARSVDLERVGYVADGITAMAVRSNVEAPDTELDSFESVEDALAWAKG